MKSSSEVKVFLGIAIVAIVLVGVTVFATRGSNVGPPPPPPEITDAQLCKLLLAPGTPILGKPNAPYTLVEFGDYQCPNCRASQPEVEKLIRTYGDRMNYVFHHFTIRPEHYFAPTLARAVGAAAEQGKFWEMHRRVFTTKVKWESMEPSQIIATVKRFANELGLDQMRFTAFLQGDDGFKLTMEQDALARKANVTVTPSFFLIKPGNRIQRFVSTPQTVEELKKPETWK